MPSKVVYEIPPSLPDSTEILAGWLRAYGFTPQVTYMGEGPHKIELPEDQVPALKLLAKAEPARFRNYLKEV